LNQLDIHQVLAHLPHRYPFLLVDRVLHYDANTITAIKNVTINEPFFQGHFPNRPVMPGVLVIEALAQAALIQAFKALNIMPSSKTVYYFVGIDNARFKRPVEPGDQLILKAAMKRRMKGIWMFATEALVGEEQVAAADLMCAARDIA
jgi:3-hydroxyacyl-[acyl-carrier-protein] dehydratase